MTSENFIHSAIQHIGSNIENCRYDNIVLVWYCKTIQNHKGIFFDRGSNNFVEVTYNGDAKEMYLDFYKKENKVIIKFA